MASVPLPFLSTKETTNYARLCRLLVDVGSQALRDTFDNIHPPATLHTVLSSHSVHYATLQSLYRGGRRKVLNPTQWGKLYPVHSRVTSASFDITLLTVLLRNICGLTPPTTGWDCLPPAADTSIADDIARVKYYRNTVYGHASQASVDDTSFNAYWQEIRDALVRLGGASFRVYIDNLEHDCMDPDIEEHYCALVEQWWKKDDDSIKDKLEEMEESIRDSLEQMRSEIENNMEEMKERLETLTSAAEEKRDEGIFRDDLEKMKSEIENISDKLGTLTATREAKETKEEGAWGESTENPCFSNQALEGDDRSVTLAQEFNYKCDGGLKKGWYRFINNKGIPMKMATQWVSVNRCGTYSTVWLNDEHPAADQGSITCEVCANVANITVECPWPWTIRVKNCREFFVYELNPTPDCPMRYCTSK